MNEGFKFVARRCEAEYFWEHRAGSQSAGTKVFCFFFAKKKALLHLPNQSRAASGNNRSLQSRQHGRADW